MTHIPVLLKETLEYLNIETGTKFIDGTVGGGGHALAILETNKQALVLGIDLDISALSKLKENIPSNLLKRCILVHGSYADIYQIAEENHFLEASGVLLDLGFSSYQLDEGSRGFSFQKQGPLDMRYDSSQSLTAWEVVNRYPEAKLKEIIKEYGEEKFAFKIASEIVKQRISSPIDDTTALLGVITQALPKPYQHKASDTARRIFQALRIEVNAELENLKKALPDALRVLAPGRRLVVITFHSLEDRIVKKFFNDSAKDCVCPPDFPTCVCDKVSVLRILTRKVVTASDEEMASNPRSKSAKLRAAEKI